MSPVKPETRAAHSATGLERTTVFPYVDGEPGPLLYQRYGHPVGAEAERVLSELDGGHTLLFPSGAGATTAVVLALLEPGDTVALPRGAYYGTWVALQMLERWGLRSVEFDQTGPAPAGAALVCLEAPANPFLTFPDISAHAEAAHAAGARLLVDATASTPVLLRPLEHGADLVLHSATKYLVGHSDALLGAVTCRDEADRDRLLAFRTVSGIVAAPDPAWLLLRGLKTLHLRVRRQSETALELARRLQAHPAVSTVRYPGLGDPVAERYLEGGFGGLLSFDVDGGEAARKVETALRLIANQTSLGGVESSLESRHRWEGDRVPEGLLRLSVGVEDVEDLWADLEAALTAAQ